MSTKDDIKQQIKTHERRLAKLKLQQARQGYNADPAVALEIEDIEREVAALRAKLAAAPTATAQPSELDAPPARSHLGGVNLSNIRDSDLKTGDLEANVEAGGDVVGGHKSTTISGSGNVFISGSTIHAGPRSVVGSAAGGDIHTGDVNTGVDDESLARLFETIYHQIEANRALSPSDKEDLAAEIEELKGRLDAPGDAQVSDSFVRRRLRTIEQMAPDIIDTIATTAVNPVAGLKGGWAKIVAKARKIQAARG